MYLYHKALLLNSFYLFMIKKSLVDNKKKKVDSKGTLVSKTPVSRPTFAVGGIIILLV